MNEKFLTFLGNTVDEEGKSKILDYIKGFENSGKDIKNKEHKMEFNKKIDEILVEHSK